MLRGQPPGCLPQRGDVLVRVDVGDDPVAGLGQQPGRRDLGGRVQGAEVAGKPAGRALPDRPPHRCRVRWLLRPGQGVVNRQVLGARALEVGGELPEHLALVGQLVTHGAAGGQVVGGRGGEPGHRPAPGHGIASSRRAIAFAAAVALLAAVFLCGREFVRTRTLESLAYPLPAIVLGASYTVSLVTHLVRRAPMTTIAIRDDEVQPVSASRARIFPLSRLWHPLMLILAIQAGLSLSLVWCNTAFGDEADYLWGGHLEISHWLHGTSVPQTLTSVYSGSPIIYPPLGAMADALGGLAAARILSLIFLLGATAALYSMGFRLFGQRAAVCASILWAISESVIRLGAYATYDAMSVTFTVFAGWLLVQASFRHHKGELIAAAAATLALSDATAYSGVSIVPVVLAFAFLIWLPHFGARQASYLTAWFAGGWGFFFGILMTVSHSWAGILFTVFNRQLNDQASYTVIINGVWTWSGLTLTLGLLGAIVAFSSAERNQVLLLCLLGVASFVVPLAQIKAHTEFALDKHLAYGSWFAALSAGYAFTVLSKHFPTPRRALVIASCFVVLSYPIFTGWEAAWMKQHAWANTSSFVAAFRPIAAHNKGIIYMPGGDTNIAAYYTPQGHDWRMWASEGHGISLDPKGNPDQWSSYYNSMLSKANYSIIALFYNTTFSTARMPSSLLLSRQPNQVYERLLSLIGNNSGEPGLSAFTVALENDKSYKLAAVGPDDTVQPLGSSAYGLYAIWKLG